MRERISWSVAVMIVYLVSCGLSAIFFRTTPAFFKVDEGTPLKAGQTLHYEVQLGSQFLAALQKVNEDDQLIVFLRGANEKSRFRVSIHAGDPPYRALPAAYKEIGKYAVGSRLAAQAVSELSWQHKLTIEITNTADHDEFLFGWQRGDLTGRRCRYSVAGDEGTRPAILPAVEVRLVRPNGRMKVAGF